MKHLLEPSVPFPVIVDEFIEDWSWPSPPFVWRHEPAPAGDVAQPCRVELQDGACSDGELRRFDIHGRTLDFRPVRATSDLTIPFDRLRQVTLTTPLKAAAPRRDGTVERVPAGAQQRTFVVSLVEPGKTLTGTSLGRVETDHGLFLFTPTDEEKSVRRVFVPRAAYTSVTFGRSAEEIAADRWIADREGLLAALANQRSAPVMPIGQALLSLGLVTPAQVERALAQTIDKPLGERLVGEGAISRADLATALAHKMGYPLVDVGRFPIEREAAQKVPLRLAVWARALPLMVDGRRVIVAVDKPARIERLRTVKALAGVGLTPVLASRSKIISTLARLAQQDVWGEHVPASNFFETTTT